LFTSGNVDALLPEVFCCPGAWCPGGGLNFLTGIICFF
jgi:hypothetical protein